VNSGETKEIAKCRLKGSGMIDRREFLMAGGALAFAAPVTASPQSDQRGTMQTNITDPFRTDNARLVISISRQMEAGAQPESGAESPLPKIDPKYPGIAATKWYEYGFKEGLPRLLDMFDRHKVKVTSHMVGPLSKSTPPSRKRSSSVATSPQVTAILGRRSIP
jgi:hypothetical protein